jgi:monovalent cation/hydrogen antiporter
MGITMGLITQTFSKHLLDPIVGVIFSFTIPYMTYILADFFEFSGVLAVVANGLIGSRVLMTHSSSLRRVVGVATWDIFIILLNCFVFILIGAQLGTIISEMSSKEFHLYIAYGVMITLMVMALRMAWVYIECSIAYYRGEKRPQMFKEAALIGWSGMRAIVSLAAALALPFTLSDGTPLPGRDDVIFMTFVVIMLSLLVPGLSLPVVIKWLKISHHSEHDSKHGTAATLRKQLAHIAEKEIHRLHAIAHLNDEEKEFFTHYFHARQRVYETPNVNPQQDSLHSTRINILRVQREQLLKMWKNREIDDMHLRLLGRELDIEESLSARAEIN